MKIFQFPCREDNYGVILHDPATSLTISIDAPETEAVSDVLNSKNYRLTHILTTHHHGDHVAGNMHLKAEHACTIIGPEQEKGKIPGIDQSVDHGAAFELQGHRIEVIGTPGHTLGGVSYHFPDLEVAFAGDCLFAMGCGRIFEGDAAMMHTSLKRLAALPDKTKIYAGHEYTLANARFARSIDPDNEALRERARKVELMLDEGKPTLPTDIGMEKATNPFLRTNDTAIARHLGMEGASEVDIFTEIRARKDRF